MWKGSWCSDGGSFEGVDLEGKKMVWWVVISLLLLLILFALDEKWEGKVLMHGSAVLSSFLAFL